MSKSFRTLDDEQKQGFIKAFYKVFPEKSTLEAETYLSDSYHIELYELDDSIRAFLVLRSVGDELEIIQLGTIPEARGQGFAFQLIEWLEEHNFKKLFLEVAENNLPAINLYEKAGFAEYSRRKSYYKVNDPSGVKYIDAIMMQKIL